MLPFLVSHDAAESLGCIGADLADSLAFAAKEA